MIPDVISLIVLTAGIILIAGSLPHITLHFAELWKDLIS
jgi:hypothetical protein